MSTPRAPRSAPRISPIFLALLAVTVGGALLAGAGSPTVVRVGTVVLVLAGWAVSLCLHEFGHAVVADRCGDHSVRAMGYLTLDIRRYTNVGLTIVLPLVILLLNGIPLPGGAVWIRRGVLSRPAATAVALAGPAVNLLLGVLLAAVAALVPPAVGAGLSFLALIQLIATVLNLLPLPGLDGFSAIDPYLPAATRQTAARVAPFAPLVLLAVLLALPAAGGTLLAAAQAVFAAVGGSGDLAVLGQQLFSIIRLGR